MKYIELSVLLLIFIIFLDVSSLDKNKDDYISIVEYSSLGNKPKNLAEKIFNLLRESILKSKTRIPIYREDVNLESESGQEDNLEIVPDFRWSSWITPVGYQSPPSTHTPEDKGSGTGISQSVDIPSEVTLDDNCPDGYTGPSCSDRLDNYWCSDYTCIRDGYSNHLLP